MFRNRLLLVSFRRSFSSLQEIDTSLLGKRVRDPITQFSGVVTKSALYYNGCAQSCVETTVEEDKMTKLVGWFVDTRQLNPLEEIKTKKFISFRHELGSEAVDITGIKGRLTCVTVGMDREVHYDLQLSAENNKMAASYRLSENRLHVTQPPPTISQQDKDHLQKNPGGPMKKADL